MKKKSIKVHTKTNWAKLRSLKDSDIDKSDIPELGEKFFRNAVIRMPKPKKMVSIRLDEPILNWFKRQGPGYQTKINEILKMYMNAKAA